MPAAGYVPYDEAIGASLPGWAGREALIARTLRASDQSDADGCALRWLDAEALALQIEPFAREAKFHGGLFHAAAALFQPLNLGNHVRYLMRLCYWYIGIFVWFYRETLGTKIGSEFATEFFALTPRIKKLQPALEEQLDRLHEELVAQRRPEGLGLTPVEQRNKKTVKGENQGRD